MARIYDSVEDYRSQILLKHAGFWLQHVSSDIEIEIWLQIIIYKVIIAVDFVSVCSCSSR